MSITPADTTPSYQVVGITPGQYGQDPAGNTIQGHLVRYRLADGTPGEVLVPDSRWTPEAAQMMIEDAVRTTWAVRSLGSTGS